LQLNLGVRLLTSIAVKRAVPDLRPIRQKSLDDLEGIEGVAHSRATSAGQEANDFRRKPIGELSAAELRRAIVSRMGVQYLIPLAIERLEADPLAATVFAKGDLLLAVLRAEPHWSGQHGLRPRVRTLVEEALRRLAKVRPIVAASDEVADPDDLDAYDRKDLEPRLRAALETLE
jgi:hypothetical protein